MGGGLRRDGADFGVPRPSTYPMANTTASNSTPIEEAAEQLLIADYQFEFAGFLISHGLGFGSVAYPIERAFKDAIISSGRGEHDGAVFLGADFHQRLQIS